MPTAIDGTKVRAGLMKAVKRRQGFLDAAKQIEKTIFKPLDLDPNTGKPFHKQKAGYTDMAGSRLASMVLEFATKHEGKVAVADVQKLFRTRGVKCSPYVLLTRMVKANIIERTGRGLYVRA